MSEVLCLMTQEKVSKHTNKTVDGSNLLDTGSAI